MPHLAPHLRSPFLIQMQSHAGNFKCLGEVRRRREPYVSKQISDGAGTDERGVAEREIACGAHQLFKLAGHASALALVIAVVWTRREFVDQQAPLPGHEHLHAEQTFNAEFFDDRSCQLFCAGFDFRVDPGGENAPGKNLIFVVIACGGIRADFARRVARRHHADLADKVEGLFGDRRFLPDAGPRIGDNFPVEQSIHADAYLAAAVVPATSDLEKHTAGKCPHGVMQLFFAADDAKRTDRKSVLREPRFLQRLVLDDTDRLNAGTQRCQTRDLGQSIHADLLYLERYGIGSARQFFCGFHVVPLAHDGVVDDKTGWTFGLRIHHAHAITHGACCHGGHTAELTSAENANQAAWFNGWIFLVGGRFGSHCGNSCFMTSSVRAARQAASRS